jgi:putative flippase GtrA
VDSRAAIAHNAAMPGARSATSRARGLAGRLRSPELRRQFIRFSIVGVANTVISFVAYRLLLAVGVVYVAAAPLAWGAGAVNGYVFNRRWTFEARPSTRARILYVLVMGAGAGSSSLLVLLFARGVGLGKVEAFLAALAIITVSTFVANRVWTFSDRD